MTEFQLFVGIGIKLIASTTMFFFFVVYGYTRIEFYGFLLPKYKQDSEVRSRFTVEEREELKKMDRPLVDVVFLSILFAIGILKFVAALNYRYMMMG